MVSDEFQGGKSPVHNQAAYLKAQQIAQQNQAVQQQRQEAPSGLSADSPQYQQVKAAEAKAAQQAYVSGQFSQKGTSQDKYAGAREAALASGRFDYGTNHSSAFYSPPDTFVNKQGQRVSRLTAQQQREAIYKGYLPASTTVSTPQQEAAKATLIYGPQVEYGGMGKFGPTTNPLLPSATGPVSKLSEQTSYSMAPQFQTFTILPQKESVIPPAKSTNPELRQAVLQTFVNDPSSLKYTGTDKGSYLYALAAKGVLAQEDFGFLNQLATSYNAKVEAQNIQAKQAFIKAELKSRQDITNNLQAAKAAGVTSVNILDAKGNVVGTVNPQNIPEARLQTLKLLSRSGGVSMGYNVVSKTQTQQVTSTQTIQNYREDPLSLFARPILALGAEIGLQLKQTFTTGKFATPPIISLLKGEPIQTTTPEVGTQVEKSFGISQEVAKITGGGYQGGSQAAALAGIVASVAIPAVAGMSGIGKIPEFAALGARFKGTTVTQTVPKVASAMKEGELIVSTGPRKSPNVQGSTRILEQGTEIENPLTSVKYEKAPTQLERLGSTIKSEKIDIGGGKSVEVSEKVPSGTKVRSVSSELPKGISLTKPIETIGQIGTKEPDVFPTHKQPSKIEFLLSRTLSSIKGEKPGGQLKVVSTPEEPFTLGFTYKSQKTDIFLNAATELKGSFKEENIIDTLSHESLHHALKEAGGLEASSKLDEIPRDVINLGIEPETLTPKFEIPTTAREIERIDKALAKTQESISEPTFEGQTQSKKPIFGKVIKQAPNILELNPAESGQAVLSVGAVSEHQVGFVRRPSGLEKQNIIIKNPSPELASTLGMKVLEGQPKTYIGKATKGTLDYLKYAQKAGLVSEQLQEIHVQAREDFLKNPQAYTEFSREPELFKNKFPDIVRPQVSGYYESVPLKSVLFKKPSIGEQRPFKPMKPFSAPTETKTFAGQEGKSKAILEEKPVSEQIKVSPEIFKTQSTTERPSTYTIKPGIQQQRQKLKEETETSYLQYPKTTGVTIPITSQGVITIPNITQKIREGFTSKTENLTRTDKVTPLITTTPKITQTPTTTTRTIPKQTTVPVLDVLTTPVQITVPTTITPPPPTETPVDKKRIFGGGGALGIGGGPGMLGKVGKYGERKEFIGNVPTESIVGVYKRGEISYGKRASTQEAKEVSKASTGRFAGRRTGKLL